MAAQINCNNGVEIALLLQAMNENTDDKRTTPKTR
jgi:hypothetical protein